MPISWSSEYYIKQELKSNIQKIYFALSFNVEDNTQRTGDYGREENIQKRARNSLMGLKDTKIEAPKSLKAG